MTPEETLDALWAMLNRPEGDQQALKLLADIRAQARAEALEEAIGAAENERLLALSNLDQGRAYTEREWINKGRVSAAEAIIAAIKEIQND